MTSPKYGVGMGYLPSRRDVDLFSIPAVISLLGAATFSLAPQPLFDPPVIGGVVLLWRIFIGELPHCFSLRNVGVSPLRTSPFPHSSIFGEWAVAPLVSSRTCGDSIFGLKVVSSFSTPRLLFFPFGMESFSHGLCVHVPHLSSNLHEDRICFRPH